ncbi:GAF domain-containing sensor histidine kinase [Pedobacter flavus]|uniref:histidine kinase n=1 Tax=Pedobacter flavus TaxID=3113906 RepID=A0ABU7H1U0_9SPHI|nr:HAMP domain-containing sensor histidine kinase [Pedobacter sp. VNH31]MEE1885290.1 HAMP domain-containing sensor histidine kinase [Pedobacter sp. VNH31]
MVKANSLNVDYFEIKRLHKLYRYEILNTPPDAAFEKIAILASEIFKTPIATISFIDDKRIFFKSIVGEINVVDIPRNNSLFNLNLDDYEIVVFNDISNLANSPTKFAFQVNDGINFMASAPLVSKEGFIIGSISILDYQAKAEFSSNLYLLSILSSIIMDILEQRLTSRIVIRTQRDRLNRVVHDIKNALTTIKLSSEIIQTKTKENEIVQTLTSKINSASGNTLKKINSLLDTSSIEAGRYALKIEPCDLLEILETVYNNLELVAKSKSQDIKININNPLPINGDKSKLTDLFENLVSNGLKFSFPNSTINIGAVSDEQNVVIYIKDEGLGLSEDDYDKLFKKFVSLSSQPTGKEHSNGLGLFLVKTITDLHHGKVWAESKGKNQGTTFYISLPRAVVD